MKIMFVSYRLSNGGAERVMTIMANNLNTLGYDVVVVAFTASSDEYPLNSNITKVYLFKDSKEGFFKSVRMLKKQLKKYEPDVVISFLTDIECFFANKKAINISTVRNNPASNLKSIKHKIKDYVYYHSDLILIQNAEQLNYFKSKIHNKIQIIQNPISNIFIDVNKEYSDKIKKIVTAGRLVPQKNHKLLIDSVLKLRNSGFEITLDIYGAGQLKNELLMYINSKNADEYIKLKGRNDNIQNLLPQYDLFVLSSNEEGSPNALLEAMAVGLPCISTRCPTGPRSIIDDYSNGLLCNVNDLNDMVKKIRFMIENNDSAIIMGKNAKLYISDNYSERIVAKRLDRIVGELVEKR